MRLSALAKALGLGEQDDATRSFALLGVIGFAIGYLALQLAVSATTEQPLLAADRGYEGVFAFDQVRHDDADFWKSDAPLAGEQMDVLAAATAMISATALVVVFFVLWQRYSIWMASAIVGAGVLFGVAGAGHLSSSGIVTRFLMFDVVRAAEALSHLPPNSEQALENQLLFMSRFGFSAAFAIAFAVIVFALRGRHDELTPQVLRARWRAVFTLYLLAMTIVALLAMDAAAVLAYAASPLNDADETAHANLSTTVASFMGASLTILLVITCAPGFLSVRRDIERKASEAVAGAQPPLDPDDWIKRENLEITPLESLATGFATLSPALLPSVGELLGLTRNL